MPNRALAALLPQVRAIAREAGQVILRFYLDEAYTQAIKADGSPVTAADHAAEAVILPALHHLTPDIPVISEEHHAAGKSVTVSGDFWLVDPLDGTRSFVERSDEFTVNIALVRGGVPVLGVIHLPVQGEYYSGAGPGTAAHIANGRERLISARRAPADGLVVAVSRRHNDDKRVTEFLGGKKVASFVRCSSAHKFCLLAEGKADLYPRFGPTHEWDTAAGQAILEAAGGTVETPDGRPIAYGKPNFLNGEFVAYGRR